MREVTKKKIQINKLNRKKVKLMKQKSPRTHQFHSPSPRSAKIYPYLSDHREINESDVKYGETCNLQKVNRTAVARWMEIAAHLIFIRSTIQMISRDLLTRWNAIILGKRKGRSENAMRGKKDHFELFDIFGQVFLKKVSGHLAYEETTNMLNLSS